MADSHLPARIHLTPDMIELIKNTICKGATNDELKLFVYVCEKRQLDPFARQIYALKRRTWNHDKNGWDEVMTIQTAIDGYRLIAERTGKYAGQLGPFFTEDGEHWLDCWVKDTPPKAAKVAVIRNDFKEPIWAVARFQAYCPRNQKGEPTGQWKTMGEGQLAKCAEALAFRRAFPEELSGIYTHDEMQQADLDITSLQIKQQDVGQLSPKETPRAKEVRVEMEAGSQPEVSGFTRDPEPYLNVVVHPDTPVDGDMNATIINAETIKMMEGDGFPTLEQIDNPDDPNNRLVTYDEALQARDAYEKCKAKPLLKKTVEKEGRFKFTRFLDMTRGQLDVFMKVARELPR